MRKVNMGWMMGLALALAVPSFSSAFAASPKAADEAGSMSKDDQQKLSEHNKLRMEIKKVKYPAPKATVVSKVDGDDKRQTITLVDEDGRWRLSGVR